MEVPLRASTRVRFYGSWTRRIIYIDSNENSAPGVVQSGPGFPSSNMVLDLRWAWWVSTGGTRGGSRRTKMFSDKEYNEWSRKSPIRCIRPIPHPSSCVILGALIAVSEFLSSKRRLCHPVTGTCEDKGFIRVLLHSRRLVTFTEIPPL